MIYLNMKTQQGTETIDQIDRKDFETFKEYKTELKSMIENYHMCNMQVYKSQRACKDW
jgi:hypothetical protein